MASDVDTGELRRRLDQDDLMPMSPDTLRALLDAYDEREALRHALNEAKQKADNHRRQRDEAREDAAKRWRPTDERRDALRAETQRLREERLAISRTTGIYGEHLPAGIGTLLSALRAEIGRLEVERDNARATGDAVSAGAVAERRHLTALESASRALLEARGKRLSAKSLDEHRSSELLEGDAAGALRSLLNREGDDRG